MNNIVHLLRCIHIHPLFWLSAAFAIATARFMELCILLFIVFVHEMGHAAAASFFSWRIRRIALLPFGGMAEMEEHGNRPLKEELIVVLAGPLQHLWMIGAGVLFTWLEWIPETYSQMFLHFNFMIVCFNLLPIWPLDGGKLLFLLLSLKKPFPKAHRQALVISFSSLLFFTLITAILTPYNLNGWLIIGFLSFSLYHEWKQRRFIFIRFLLERYYGKKNDLTALRPLIVREHDFLSNVLERFHRGCKHPIVVEEVNKEKRILDENEILHAFFAEKRVSDKISDLLYSY